MKNLAINPELIKDNNILTFKNIPSIYNGFTDVIYEGKRIAIINGFSAPLMWTAKNGSNIPVNVIVQLESMVKEWIEKTNIEEWNKKNN